jgi:carboxypeptidase T
MKNQLLSLLAMCGLYLCASNVLARDPSPVKISKPIEETKRYFVHLRGANYLERSQIANLIHIDSIIEDSVYSLVNQHDLDQLKKELPHLIRNHHLYQPQIPKSILESDEYEFPVKDEKYHTYQEVIDEIDALVSKYPQLVKKLSLGKSVEGRELWGVRITNFALNKDQTVPGIIMTGTHHAREHLSTEVPVLAIHHLLNNYSQDSEIQRLIDNRDIYIFPIINPDGMLYDIKGRRYKSWRKNRALNQGSRRVGVDLNRNYSFGWGTGGSSGNPGSDVYMGPHAFSEPETQAVKKFVESNDHLRIFLSFHTFSELILYPWGGRRSGIGGTDQAIHEAMAKTMSKWNNYKPMQASGLYVASGDTCDWAYGEHGMFCFTFELSPSSRWNGGFYPGAKVIDKTFKANIRPILYLIDKAADPYSAGKRRLAAYQFQ